MTTVQMVGGGIQNKLLCQLTADFTGRTVITGPIEAECTLETSCHNCWTLEISSRKEAQEIIMASEPVTRYESRAISNLEEIRLKFNKAKRGNSVMLKQIPKF